MNDELTEKVARRMWFESCDCDGWPNGRPTWDEMVAMTDPQFQRTVYEFRAMASGAIAVIRGEGSA